MYCRSQVKKNNWFFYGISMGFSVGFHHTIEIPGWWFQTWISCSISYIWVNYNDLTETSLEIMVSKGNHPQMALIQVGELL